MHLRKSNTHPKLEKSNCYNKLRGHGRDTSHAPHQHIIKPSDASPPDSTFERQENGRCIRAFSLRHPAYRIRPIINFFFNRCLLLLESLLFASPHRRAVSLFTS